MRNTDDRRRFLTLLVLALLAWSVSLTGQGRPVAASIDIKPGSAIKTIDRHATAIPLAILGSETVDVKRLDLTTITLAGAPVLAHGDGTLQGALEDVNRDGVLDLIVPIDAARLQISSVDATAVMRAFDFDGVEYRGTDSISLR